MTEYGPFHRIKSPTQSYEIALKQKERSEIWGRPIAVVGSFPRVKAYLLPLCAGELTGTRCANEQGIEFATSVKPTVKAPSGLVYWDITKGPVDGIRIVDDKTIALKAAIYKLVYQEATDPGHQE